MDKEIKILIVEDNAADAELITRELGKGDFAHTTKWVKAREEYLEALGAYAPDVILCDYRMPSLGAPMALEIAKERSPETPFIVVSGTIGEEIAVETVRSGAVDYVMKDRLARLLPSIKRALNEAEARAERKRVEDALRKSEEKARYLTDSAQDAILMMDSQGAISFWNPAAKRILGYSAEEALGRNLHQLIAPERFRQAHATAFPGFLKTGQGAAIGKTLELAAIRKDGAEIVVSLSLSAVKREDGWHAVGIIRDITEKKKLENDLERKMHELEIFYKSALGREGRVLELKGEVEMLKDDLRRKNNISEV